MLLICCSAGCATASDPGIRSHCCWRWDRADGRQHRRPILQRAFQDGRQRCRLDGLFLRPRKFNIAFDGGGRIASLEDTNDIGFTAVKVTNGNKTFAPGIYSRLTPGGITGHKDFARDTGVMCAGSQCVPIAAAIVKAFIEHGDRTVGMVRYTNTAGRLVKGVASNHLAENVRPGETVRVFIHPSHKFGLPADRNLPVIMVGPGTGIAPFRAFLQERRMDRRTAEPETHGRPCRPGDRSRLTMPPCRKVN